MSFVKLRNGRGDSSFRKSRERYRAAAASSSRITDGMYATWRPQADSQWIYIPQQKYTYETYIAAEGGVVEVTEPYYTYKSHYYPASRRMFNCSRGAHLDQPCFGCAMRKEWEDARDAAKERGMSPPPEPIGYAGKRYCMYIIGVDTYYEMPALDRSGKQIVSRKGTPIWNYVPKSLTGKQDRPNKYGHAMHWSFTGTHLNQIFDMDERLRTSCATCASDLYTDQFVCADCGNIVEEYEESLEGIDLREALSRHTSNGCPHCGSSDITFVPNCDGCDDPQHGHINAFDLRIKANDIPGSKGTNLELVGFRLPEHTEEIAKMVDNPFDIVKIHEPSTLEFQARIIGESVASQIDPLYGARGAPRNFAKSYQDGDDEIEY